MASERMFPIQAERGAAPHPMRVPWSVAELAYSVYSQHHRGQTLEDLARRGGFGPGEMDHWLPGWREMCNDAALGSDLRKAAAALGVEPERVVEVLAEVPGLMIEAAPLGIETGEHHMCSKCGSSVHVPDDREWNDGDWCGTCWMEWGEKAMELLARLSPAPAEGEGVEP